MSERVFYRDRDEFNKALDAASESIRKAAGPDILGNLIWWGLLAVQGFLYTARWTIGWDIRYELLPGIDVVDPIWVILAGIFILHLVDIRNRHGSILRKRLCFGCGTPLGDVAVDEDGDGVCPKCTRAFNLGEYRRPSENRGRRFRGYLDEAHYDKAIFAAAEQIRATRGERFESDLLGWGWITLGVCFGASIVLDWDILEWLPGAVPHYGIWLGLMFGWGAWYSARVKRWVPKIVDERRCMNCGFCLSHTPTGDDGVGRCPECAAEFVVAQYERPGGEEEEDSSVRPQLVERR